MPEAQNLAKMLVDRGRTLFEGLVPLGFELDLFGPEIGINRKLQKAVYQIRF
jgi:hypothetical protein